MDATTRIASEMDPAAPFGAPIDTFAKTFSSDQYAALFAQNPHGFTSPDLSLHSFPIDHSAAPRSDTFASSKSPTSPTNAAAPTIGTNPRSCTTCRKRKVRCDKKHPCSNCNKAGIECIFPRPGRAPRRSKKPPDSELLARLRRLEGVVQSLGKGVDGEDLTPEHEDDVEAEAATKLEEVEQSHPLHLPILGQPIGCHMRAQAPLDSTGVDKEMGRLVFEEGRSRYVSNNFWASLTSEVCSRVPVST